MLHKDISLILLITVLLAQSLDAQPVLAMRHAQSATVAMELLPMGHARLVRSLAAQHASIQLLVQFASRDMSKSAICAILVRPAVLAEDTHFQNTLTETALLSAEMA